MKKTLKEEPQIGLALSRDLMPQIPKKHIKGFIKRLSDQGISSKSGRIHTHDLKASQAEFDPNKINKLAKSDDDSKILVSNDKHVADGHHRWLASHQNDEKVNAYTVDLPILALLKAAKDYSQTINEEVQRAHFDDMLDSFTTFACGHLGIKSQKPGVIVKTNNDRSFGGYNPKTQKIHITTKNRHPMDVLRTIAHELVHHKQNEEGRIADVAVSGATGSDIENEANSVAGVIMRKYAQENPDHFNLDALTESIAVFVVGGPCSGKDQITKSIKEQIDGREIDVQAVVKARTLSEHVVISCSAHQLDEIAVVKHLLEHNGYHTSMLFVDVTNQISKMRNEERQKRGQRMLSESVRFSKHVASQTNIPIFKGMFGEDMKIINNDINERFDAFVAESKPSDREEGTDSVVKIYKASTPGQIDTQKQIRQRNKDDVINASSADAVGVGPTYGQKFSGYSGLAEWANKPETIKRFRAKYGVLAEQKLSDMVNKLNNTHPKTSPKTIAKIRESIDKGILDRPMMGGPREDELGEDKPTTTINKKRTNKQRTAR